jgi:TATA-binding protein-associated factor
MQDQPWSAQDEQQIIGRVWRQRQRRPVYVVHLLAADTADITLSSMARGKKDMLDAFLTTDVSKGTFPLSLYDLLCC